MKFRSQNPIWCKMVIGMIILNSFPTLFTYSAMLPTAVKWRQTDFREVQTEGGLNLKHLKQHNLNCIT